MGFLSKLVSYVTTTGPRGGKKFINSKGHEEYGTPPKAAPKATKPVATKTPDERRAEKNAAAKAKRERTKAKQVEAAKAEKARAQAIAAGVPPCIAHLKPEQQKALADAGFGPLLHKHPARFIETTAKDGSGLYSSAEGTGVVRFSVVRRPDVPYQLNSEHEPNTSHNVWHSEHATLLHEAAHHLHFKLIDRYAEEAGRVGVTPAERMNIGYGGAYAAEPRPAPAAASKVLLNRLAEAPRTGGYAVSYYGRTDAMERFAEGHTAYVGNKAEFKRLRPDDYALIRDVRLHMGMPE